jgi:hypothetical protein
MTDLPNNCQVCKIPLDFSKHCSGVCKTCNRKYMCEDCCYTHPCVPGKRRQLIILTNPSWVMNLMKTLEKNEDRSGNTDADKT